MKSLGPTRLRQLRNEIADADNRRALEAIFGAVMREFGFSAFAAGFVRDDADDSGGAAEKPEPFLLLNWPQTWLELYARQGFAATDITLAEAANTSEPFTWKEVRQKRPGSSQHIFEAASRFGWNDGFVIPVHDPLGIAGERFGIVNLAAFVLSEFPQSARTSVTELCLAAFGAARLFDADVPAWGKRGLSVRETRALSLVASGSSDEEIAHTMGISRSTAHHHVESAKRKLNAASRAQAVAIALTNNLL